MIVQRTMKSQTGATSHSLFTTMTSKRQLALSLCRLLQAPRWWGYVDRWQGLVTLNYHRIGLSHETPLDSGVYSASAEQFEAQLRYLKLHFDVIRVSDINDVLKEGSHRRAVLITFDDGYIDNYQLAYPVLKHTGVPAVIFLTTGFLDQRIVAWWDEIAWIIKRTTLAEFAVDPQWNVDPIDLRSNDRSVVTRQLLQVAKSLTTSELSEFLDHLSVRAVTGRAPHTPSTAPWMTWDMVREMSQSGIEFGGHTVHHPVLAKCSLEEQRYEIIESKRRIETEIGKPISAFSYPTGKRWSFTDDTKRIARDAGYQWGFAFDNGFTSYPSQALDLQRIAIDPQINLDEFQAIVQIPRIFAQLR